MDFDILEKNLCSAALSIPRAYLYKNNPDILDYFDSRIRRIYSRMRNAKTLFLLGYDTQKQKQNLEFEIKSMKSEIEKMTQKKTQRKRGFAYVTWIKSVFNI